MADPTMSELMRAAVQRKFGRVEVEPASVDAAEPVTDVDAGKGVGPDVKIEHVGGERMRVFTEAELNPRSES